MDNFAAPAEHHCRNCGAAVTADYARVKSTTGDGTVGACPNCDAVWRDGRPDQSVSNNPTGTNKRGDVGVSD